MSQKSREEWFWVEYCFRTNLWVVDASRTLARYGIRNCSELWCLLLMLLNILDSNKEFII